MFISFQIKSQVVGKNSNMLKTLNAIRDERLSIISLKKDIEQLKTKYAQFHKETESIRSVFQNLIEELQYKCNRLTYFACLQCVRSQR